MMITEQLRKKSQTLPSAVSVSENGEGFKPALRKAVSYTSVTAATRQ